MNIDINMKNKELENVLEEFEWYLSDMNKIERKRFISKKGVKEHYEYLIEQFNDHSKKLNAQIDIAKNKIDLNLQETKKRIENLIDAEELYYTQRLLDKDEKAEMEVRLKDMFAICDYFVFGEERPDWFLKRSTFDNDIIIIEKDGEEEVFIYCKGGHRRAKQGDYIVYEFDRIHCYSKEQFELFYEKIKGER